MSVIGDLLVRVGADTSGLTGGLATASSAVSSAGASMLRVGGSLSLGVSAPLLAIGTSAISAASTFQGSMNTFQAVTGATGQEMAQLQATAMALGEDITLPGTSAADAAIAMTELARAGISVNDTFGAAEGVLRMSAAAQISNEQAATITAAALNAFGLAGTEATRVADLLAAGSNASAADVTDMAASMQMAASVAAMAGVPVEDLTTSIAMMANAGIVGSDAGTSLKTMLMSLMSPTDQAAALMQSLGISVYDSSGTMLPMRDIVGQVSGAMGGLTQEQQNATLATLFGTDAIRAANIVLASGTTAFDAMSTAVNQQGAATDLSSVKMAGLGGAMEGLRSTVETVLLTAALPFIESLETLVRKAGDFISGLGDLNPQILNAGIAIGAVLAVAGPLALGLGAVVMAVGALLSPIGLVILGIGALAAAFATGAIDIDTVRPILDGVGAGFQTLRQVAETVLTSIQNFWSQHGATIMASAQATWNQIQTVVTTVVNAVSSVVQAVMGVVQTFLANHGAEIESFIVTAWTGIQTIVQTSLAIIQAIVVPILTGIANFIRTHGDDIQRVLSAAWSAISGIVSIAITAVQGILSAVLAAIRGDWSGAWNALKSAGESIWNTIKSTVSSIAASLGPVLANIWAAIKSAAEGAWNGLKSAVENVITALKTAVTGKINGLKSDIESAWNAMKTAAQTAWNGLKSNVESAVSNLKTAVSSKISGLKGDMASAWSDVRSTAISKWQDIVSAITGKLSDLVASVRGFIGQMTSAGADLIAGMVAGVRSMVGALVSAAQGVVQSAIDAAKSLLGISSPSRVFHQLGEQTMSGFALGLQDVAGDVVGAMRSIMGSVSLEALEQGAEIADAVGGIVDTMTALIDAAGAMASFQVPDGITAAIDAIAVQIGYVITVFLDVAAQFEADAVSAAADFADSAGSVLDVFEAGVDVISALSNYTEANIGPAATNLAAQIGILTSELSRVATQIGPAALAAAAASGALFEDAMAPWEAGIDVVAAMADYTAVVIGPAARALADQMLGLATHLARVSDVIGPEALVAAAAAGALFEQAMVPWQAGIDVVAAIAGYTAVVIGPAARALADQMLGLATHLNRVATEIGPDALASAATAAGQLQTVVGVWEPAIDALAILGGHVPAVIGPTAQIIVDQIRGLAHKFRLLQADLADLGNLAAFTGQVADFVSGIIDVVQSMNDLSAVVGSPIDLFPAGYEIGYDWIRGIVAGINNRLPSLQAVLDYIRGLFPSSPAKYGPWRTLPEGGPVGSMFARDLAGGVDTGKTSLERAMQDLYSGMVRPSIRPSLSAAGLGGVTDPFSPSPSLSSAGGVVINVYNPKKEAAEDSIRREMRYLAAGIW